MHFYFFSMFECWDLSTSLPRCNGKINQGPWFFCCFSSLQSWFLIMPRCLLLENSYSLFSLPLNFWLTISLLHIVRRIASFLFDLPPSMAISFSISLLCVFLFLFPIYILVRSMKWLFSINSCSFFFSKHQFVYIYIYKSHY